MYNVVACRVSDLKTICIGIPFRSGHGNKMTTFIFHISAEMNGNLFLLEEAERIRLRYVGISAKILAESKRRIPAQHRGYFTGRLRIGLDNVRRHPAAEKPSSEGNRRQTVPATDTRLICGGSDVLLAIER